MLVINEELLNEYIKLFEAYVIHKNKELGVDSLEISFGEAASWIYTQEHFKYDIRNMAIQQLNLSQWKKEDLGSGKIAQNVLNAFNINGNNLVNFHQKTYLEDKLKENTYEVENVLYDVFKSSDIENAFSNACHVIGRRYDILSFLFFIKDDTKYMQVRSREFEKRFELLDIDYKLSGKCSWDNYTGYNEILLIVKEVLGSQLTCTVNLLDAHSFLWVIGEEDFLKWSEKHKSSLNYHTNNIEEINKPLINIDQIKEIDAHHLLSQAKEIPHEYKKPTSLPKKRDYKKIQSQNKLIGDSGEQAVVLLEKQKLKALGKDHYAKKVHIVKSDSCGYDVVSYDEHGRALHIEVKTCTSNKFSFFISQYEIDTFLKEENYYIYYLYNIKNNVKLIKYDRDDIKILLDKYKKPTNYIVEFKVKK